MTDSDSVVSTLSTPRSWSWTSEKRVDNLVEQSDAIQDALVPETVDLWQLRELALAPGGFVSPDLRRRAWPKLLGYHQHLWKMQSQQAVVAPVWEGTRQEISLLRHDVSRTIWNVQDHLQQAKRQHRQEEEDMNRVLSKKKTVKFQPAVIVATPPRTRRQAALEQTPKTSNLERTAATSPETPQLAVDTTFASTEEDDLSVVLDDGLYSPSGETVLTQATSFSATSRAIPWRQASAQEQKVLFHAIASVLSEESHYYTGLQDLTALMLMNLESPSLTSWCLGQLSSYHLRGSFEDPALWLQTCFLPLMEDVEPALGDLWNEYGLPVSFAKQWVACWFAQDIADATVASRILDACLVSHPLFPLYLSVALVALHPYAVRDASREVGRVYSVLRGLPSTYLDDDEEQAVNLHRAQVWIRKALEYMKQCPPKRLMQLALNRCEQLDVKHRLQLLVTTDVPEWFESSGAPNDYIVLETARALREGLLSVDSQTKVSSRQASLSKYPQSAMATGNGVRKSGVGRFLAQLVLLVVLSMAISVAVVNPEATLTTPTVYLPSTQRLTLPISLTEGMEMWTGSRAVSPRSATTVTSFGHDHNLLRALRRQWWLLAQRLRRLFHRGREANEKS